MVTKSIRLLLCLCHGQAHLQYFKCVCFTSCRRFDVMVRFFRANFFHSSRSFLSFILASAWCFGLLFGAISVRLADTSFFTTMRMALSAHVSISGLLSVMLLPLLFSVFAVYTSCFQLLIPIAFFKAYFFSFMSFALIRSFGSSVWLLRFLLMFTDCLFTPILLWLWFSACTRGRVTYLRRTAAVFPAMIGILYMDTQIISPFLNHLLSR